MEDDLFGRSNKKSERSTTGIVTERSDLSLERWSNKYFERYKMIYLSVQNDISERSNKKSKLPVSGNAI